MKIAMLGVKAVPCAGGIAAYAEQLGKRLVERGHEVTVYCRRQYLDGDAGSSTLRPHNGLRRRATPGLRGKYLDAVTHTFTSALDSLWQDYDIIHIHGSAPAVVAPLLRLRPSRRLVVTIHGVDWQGGKWGPLATGVMRWAANTPVRFAHELTVVSQGLRQFYRDNFGRETTYIPTGVELPEILPPREIRDTWNLDTDDYLLFVGRLTPEKGLDYLLSAYETLDTEKKLVIVGDANFKDPYVDDLRKRARDDVLFTGYRNGRTLAELFSNAYLYIQPSTLEGISVAVLEALSYGRCVLASDIPGNQEALGDCGHTFRAGNVDDLRRKLAMLLEDPDLVAAQYGLARKYVCREHNWETTTDQFEGLYRRVVGEDPRDVTSKSVVTAKVK